MLYNINSASRFSMNPVIKWFASTLVTTGLFPLELDIKVQILETMNLSQPVSQLLAVSCFQYNKISWQFLILLIQIYRALFVHMTFWQSLVVLGLLLAVCTVGYQSPGCPPLPTTPEAVVVPARLLSTQLDVGLGTGRVVYRVCRLTEKKEKVWNKKNIYQKIEFVVGNVATKEAVMLDRLAIFRVQLEGKEY